MNRTNTILLCHYSDVLVAGGGEGDAEGWREAAVGWRETGWRKGLGTARSWRGLRLEDAADW